MKSVSLSLVILGLLVADAIVVTKYGYSHDHAGAYGIFMFVFGIAFVLTLMLER